MSKNIDPKSMLMGWLMGRKVARVRPRAETPTAVYGYQDFEAARVKLTRDTYEDYPGGSIPLEGQHLYNGTEIAPGQMLWVHNSYETIKATPMARLGDRVRILFCIPEIETELIDWTLEFNGSFDDNTLVWAEPRIRYDPVTRTLEPLNDGGDISEIAYKLVQHDGVDYVSMSFLQSSDYEYFSGVAMRINGTKPDGLDTPVAWRFPVEDPVRVEVVYSHVTGITVAPAEATVAPGGSVQLRATVSGVGRYDRNVAWSKTLSFLGTGIEVDASGLVTVAQDATWTSRTIRAASAQDKRWYTDVTIYLKKESETA